MSKVFLEIINMSISASYIVLALLLVRFLLKKAPKWISVALWGMVALRLISPFSIESVLSLIPSSEVISPEIMTEQAPTVNTGIPIVNDTINPIISGSLAPNPGDSANPLQIWIPILTAIWIVGMVALLIYTVISYARVRRKIGTAVLLRDNIYQSENVVSPFVLGIIKPKIYLPFNLSEENTQYVVSHEMAHIRRKDHLWKPLGFLLLTLHWFNPLMWLAYVLLCRDIELACDEKVIKELDRDARADYSEALLACSVNRRMIAACPLAFGEVGVKNRVKSVLNYKKPAFWIVMVALIALVLVAVCFLTNPPSDDENNGVNPSGEIFTDYDGVYVSIKSIDINAGGHTVFNLIWHNQTSNEVMYGEPYFIERLEGDEWVNVPSEELTFTAIGLLLRPNSTAYKSYSTQRFDISKSGTYRLRVQFSVYEGYGYGGKHKECNTWIEFEVGSTPTTDYLRLRERYPEYFGLDASDGLSVWVYQMAKGDYNFVLTDILPSDTHDANWMFPWNDYKGASAEEMRAILSTYDVEKEDIYIVLSQNPISSYLSEWSIVVDGEDLNAKREYYVNVVMNMLFPDESTDLKPLPENTKNILLYSAPSYSWVSMGVNNIEIIEGMLYYSDTSLDSTGMPIIDLTCVGPVEAIEWPEDVFLSMEEDGFSELVGELRENTDKVYEVYPTSEKAVDIYYVLIQKDGSRILVFGHYKNGVRSNYIRWIYSIGK